MNTVSNAGWTLDNALKSYNEVATGTELLERLSRIIPSGRPSAAQGYTGSPGYVIHDSQGIVVGAYPTKEAMLEALGTLAQQEKQAA